MSRTLVFNSFAFVLVFSTAFMLVKKAQADIDTYYLPSDLNEFINSTEDMEDLVEDVSKDNLDPLGYKKGAKRALFGYIDLEKDKEGYFVKDVYCNKVIRSNVGPNKIPNNNTMNTEHTWPQSKGSKREPFRGDIHHLFPSDSRANSIRGNFPFGEVRGEDVGANCKASQRGHLIDPKTGKVTRIRGFQPPLEHRGNVARALFYSAAMYNKDITEIEEHYLRKWHVEDPVDDDEILRNDLVEESQGNRNPFIDFPQLVKNIKDF